jgi:outer membrane murein-binding lipoprotein Lpp
VITKAATATPARSSAASTETERIAALESQVDELHGQVVALGGEMTAVRAALRAAGYPVDDPDGDEEE